MQLGAPTTHPLAPKIAALHHLHAAGLPVPDGVVLRDPDDRDRAAWSAVATLLKIGPVIVRTALFAEDTTTTAAAGLGASIAGCVDEPAVHRALARIRQNLADPWLQAHLGPDPRAQVLIQRHIEGPWLAVIAQALVRHAELHPTHHHEPPRPPEPPRNPAPEPPRSPEPPRNPATEPPRPPEPPRNPVTETPPTLDLAPEPHDLASEPLAAGTTPFLAGPLDLLPDDLRAAIVPVCERVTAALPPTPHGLDLELAADTNGAVWIVQARPLTRPLHPDWPAFEAAAARSLGAPLSRALPGLWTLDAEHNPAPLSPAHAGLVRLLAAARPDLVTARVLAGWLYEPTRTRPTADTPIDPPPAAPRPHGLHPLDSHPETSSPHDIHSHPLDSHPAPTSPHNIHSHPLDSHPAPTALHTTDLTPEAALAALRTRHIPAARAWLAAWDLDLARADRDALVTLLPRACDHLLEILATYATLRPAGRSSAPAPPHATPLCLHDREDHLDVLPAAWDIAAPALSDLSLPTFPKVPVPTTTPDPADVPALLRELDDHLFALGLAPLRRLYLRAGALLELGDDVFLLPPEALAAALRRADGLTDLGERRAAHTREAELYPPLQLLNGLPVPPAARTYLQGLAIGPPASGPLHPRRDLADLLADPLPPGAVLAIPALTAQAAVALHALEIRAVCCEHGGAMSHAALMARELGLSALIGCRGCTGLAPGTRVHLDTRTGRLRPAD
ncbi:MAG: hypothetical protein JNL82_37035 [Myxococcales bacterium]|nr:hypothetical protein [Myxococcales bacterium]